MLLFWPSIAVLIIYLNNPIVSLENFFMHSNIIFNLRGFGARVIYLTFGMGGNSFERNFRYSYRIL